MREAPFETYRGAVAASECDEFGHLNIAFYPERFEAAARALLARLGAPGAAPTLSLDTRYLKELRAGETLVIHSLVRAGGPGLVRLAHEGVTLSGERATLAEHALAVEGEAALPAAQPAWAPFPAHVWSEAEGLIASGRDRVGGDETAADGLALRGYVRRFSDACLVAIAALGMTESYRRDRRLGFATFETRLALEPPGPQAGDELAVTSAILAIGTSSLRLQHTLRAARDGRRLARFHQAGVQFDLERRRSAPWPPALRAKAVSLGAAG